MPRTQALSHKITRAKTTNGKDRYAVGLPVELGAVLFERDLRYTAELTEEGILLRPVREVRLQDAVLPVWAEPNGTREDT